MRQRARAREAVAAAGAEPGEQAVESALRQATARLAERAGSVGGARLESELLLAHALQCSRARLLSLAMVEQLASARFEELVAARVATGRPVAYTLGARDFGELRLAVDERVLVPRPETETVVEVFRSLLTDGALPPGPLADRGTGSGNIALSVADARPVLAIDVSRPALQVARANVTACGAAGRVLLVEGDGLLCVGPGRLAAVLANPPYVEAADHAHLPDDVRLHEPRVALVPGEGSVAAMFARLLAEARAALMPGGWLITEVGAGQAALVASLASVQGYAWVTVQPDLSGIDRVVAARRA